jgi:hypothetical protein
MREGLQCVFDCKKNVQKTSKNKVSKFARGCHHVFLQGWAIGFFLKKKICCVCSGRICPSGDCRELRVAQTALPPLQIESAWRSFLDGCHDLPRCFDRGQLTLQAGS